MSFNAGRTTHRKLANFEAENEKKILQRPKQPHNNISNMSDSDSISNIHITTTESPSSTKQPDWIHPHLLQTVDPTKGRQFRVSDYVEKDACLLVDRPYALIPVVDDPATSNYLLCSNSSCNRPTSTDRVPCFNGCIEDVAWCSEVCREYDRSRHDVECTWLRRYAASIRAKWGTYIFGMLWLVVRILAMRLVELQECSVINGAGESNRTNHRWKHGWDAINAFCGSPESWGHDQVKSWSVLVRKYLQSNNSALPPHGLSSDRVLHLICQEEANSFGLYPRETGDHATGSNRGEQYAAAVYPTAAIANHSCCPNVSIVIPSAAALMMLSFCTRLYAKMTSKVT